MGVIGRSFRGILAAGVVSAAGMSAALAASCPAERTDPLLPTDTALCQRLAPLVADPPALPLGAYERQLGRYLRNYCHRDAAAGWVRDKSVRDTGPYVTSLIDGAWDGSARGTHAPVVIWYNAPMAAWIKANRRAADEARADDAAPVPADAIMVKEMYPGPASRCADVEPTRLFPTSGAAVMVRAPQASQDGWFWGCFGFGDKSGWTPDWPADPETNRLAYMGFGQYCTNCHASARDHFTFSAAKNLQGEPGDPLVFLSQDFALSQDLADSHHTAVVQSDDDADRLDKPLDSYAPAFLQAFASGQRPGWAPDGAGVDRMPSQTYDNVWMGAGTPTASGQFLTSDQCLGCHDAGSTGLQFDMTTPNPHAELDGGLLNLSPYGTWRSSPMGLAGRDPIFFAQMASETQTFHPDAPDGLVENTCLGCHGIQGQRQYGIDRQLAGQDCGSFSRDMVAAVPWPAGNSSAPHADYGALARDGISCTACHRMVLGDAATQANAGTPRNACVEQRQALLNPDNTGFAKTFTGSFLVGPPDRIYGPFADVRTAPMQSALGVVPQHSDAFARSEVCGTCHTVHLPVLQDGRTVGRVYEQLTYPEWAFSAYRTGQGVNGEPLPAGPGDRAQSCQDCHMPTRNIDGTLARSKIASIQEVSNFPEAEFTKPAEELDLPVRDGYSRHTLVGLNVFLIEMAQQFPEVLGIRTEDPMLGKKGVPGLKLTEQQMLRQARESTARLSVDPPTVRDGKLETQVTLENLAGHKFPSGVGFRRAFITFQVLDTDGQVLWASGATDGAGRILDGAGQPIDGEVWWTDDCSARIDPLARKHQPHHQTIAAQDQAQIYQELVSTPAPDGPAQCGHAAEPAGHLTTSFLSICAEVKDNRLLPHGYLPTEQRVAIAKALGAGTDMGEDAGTTAVDDDDYATPPEGASGRDSLTYTVELADLDGAPAHVRAWLNYQATPPFYLQDRFCTAEGKDRGRLFYLAGHLDLDGTPAADWSLRVGEQVSVPIAAR